MHYVMLTLGGKNCFHPGKLFSPLANREVSSMEDDLSLKFDDHIARVLIAKARSLGLGDEFELDGKQYLVTTKRVPFGACEGGDRVRLRPRGSWRLVWRHGRENILWPLVDGHDPFSDRKKGSFRLGHLPHSREKVEGLTSEPVVLEPDIA